MPKCGFILISVKIAKIRMPRLASFSLYNSPAWLKTRSDGADVTVIPRSSRAVAFRYGKRFSLFHYPETRNSNFLSEGHISYCTTSKAGLLTLYDYFGICYILPNQQVFCKELLHYWKNVFAGRIWPSCRSWETPALKHHRWLTVACTCWLSLLRRVSG